MRAELVIFTCVVYFSTIVVTRTEISLHFSSMVQGLSEWVTDIWLLDDLLDSNPFRIWILCVCQKNMYWWTIQHVSYLDFVCLLIKHVQFSYFSIVVTFTEISLDFSSMLQGLSEWLYRFQIEPFGGYMGTTPAMRRPKELYSSKCMGTWGPGLVDRGWILPNIGLQCGCGSSAVRFCWCPRIYPKTCA